MSLQNKFGQKVPVLRDEIKALIKEHGDKVISEVTIAQAYGGMRGVKGLVCDTSLVDPEKGLIIRDIPISELTEKLPEEIFYLLVMGELPDNTELKALQEDFNKRSGIPGYVWDVLRAMPNDSHPMAMFDTGILVMERESIFRQKYAEGIPKTDYWEPVLEDSISLLAKLPSLAAGVYQIRYKDGNLIPWDNKLDWGANYAKMLGLPDPNGDFTKLIRLYLVLHSDHEGGNVSAFSCHTVASALSDPYYAVSAGLNGLAGPLHGLANQECLKFVLGIKEKFGGVPTKEQLIQFAWDTLNSGQVIPGYGHAVLRATDPRYTAFREFGLKYMADDPVFQIVNMMFENIPAVLQEHGKAKNPWPNVDAGSGALLHHYGLTEFEYYTVLFSVSRAMGMCSQFIINRALGTAITRPKSIGTTWVKQQVGNA
jgi:citrate synthase